MMHSIRKIFLLCVLFFTIINAAVSQKKPETKTPEKPNIIFILTDDQRWDALAYAGNKIIETPEMDKLAKEGVYFGSAIVTTPICAASRASIFSGVHERTHRYTFQTGPMKEAFYEESYPALLRKSGYYTGFFGKFGVRYQSLDPLFDEYDDYDRNNQFKDKRGYFYKTIGKDTVHLTRYTGQQALDFIDNSPSEKPFCLSLSFSAPHAHDGAPDQYFWQEETDGLYQNMEMPPPLLGEDQYFNALPQPVQDGFNRLRWTWRYDTPEKYQHSVKGYYRMIRGIDLEIEKIRKKLKEKGLDKNTIIILMGDNGYFLGERQLAGKWLMYDNSIRVPLIVYDPRVKNHQDIEDMALNIDVPPTILDFAGVPRPASWQGLSLVPVVEGLENSIGRDTVLIEHLWDFDQIPPSEGVRTADWKYMRYVNDQSEEELYNLIEDPLEIKNLANEKKCADVLEALRKKCNELGKKYSDPFSGTPVGLSVDFIREPKHAEINDLTPDYGWIVPAEAVSQNACQVLVSSSKELSEDNIGDVWNSGRVPGKASINVKHAGEKLKPNSTYFWKVRIWDVDNRLSDYSEVQVFKTGTPDGLITTNNIFQIDTVPPAEFRKTSDDSYFVDFGKAAFATLELKYTAKSAGTLIFHIGEQLDGEHVNRDPQGNIKYQEVKMPVTPGTRTYLLQIAPNERNTKPEAVALPDSFPVIMPFRYCDIESASGDISLDDIKQLAFHAYFDENQSSFQSPDTVLNQVWDLCKYSIKATSFAGIYVDGERERIPYEADAYLNQLSHYNTDREYAVTRRTIEYFMEYPTWPTEWQLHVALMFYQDYMYTGNTELITKYYEQLKFKTLDGLSREDGLISSESDKLTPQFMAELGFKDPKAKLKDIVDWPPAQKDTGWKLATEEGERDGYVFMPINTVINALFYKNMEVMAMFAEVLGKSDEALDFKFKALKAKKAINEKLFDHKTGAYVDGEGTDHSSLHANMFVLAFGLVPEENMASVVKFMKTRGMACSVYGSQYLMEGLYNAGAAEYALELLTATDDRSWYNMIRVGSTITLEAWDMKYKPNADWNHAWGAVPANIIPRGLWGIEPKTAGYGIAKIKPQLADLPESSIVVPTIRGLVKADFVKISNRLSQYTIELPGNMAGELTLSDSAESDVTLNGQKVLTEFGTIRLEPGVNVIQLSINSF